MGEEEKKRKEENAPREPGVNVAKHERIVQPIRVSSPERAAARSDAAKPRPRPHQQKQQVRNPAKVGKANPKRDIPIFLGLVAFLFLIAYSMSGIGGSKEVQKKKTIKELQDDLRRTLEASQKKEQARKRTVECSLFLAPSSIPGTGLGIFAGERFNVGDEVIHPGVVYPFTRETDADEKTLLVTQIGFLLKHHPFLANLHGGKTYWSKVEEMDPHDPYYNVDVLHAQRVIEPGEELFLPLEAHPQNVLGSIEDVFDLPTLADYEMADDIVQDEIRTQRRGPMKRKAAMQSVAGNGPLLMVKRAVEKFNKKVAALLPGSAKALELRDLLETSSAFSALSNRTVNFLETKGQCLDDVRKQPSQGKSFRQGLFARRSIKKGNVIVPAPLYIRRRDNNCLVEANVCNASTTEDSSEHCFGHKNSSILLCPLSSAAFVQVASSGDDSTSKANAVMKWSVNDKLIQKLTIDETLKNYTTRLAFDVVALRAIKPGEEILIEEVKSSVVADRFIHVADGIYPDAWKDYKVPAE